MQYIHIHGQPRPVLRVNLYFDGTQVSHSFAAFGGSYAPGYTYPFLTMEAIIEYKTDKMYKTPLMWQRSVCECFLMASIVNASCYLLMHMSLTIDD